MKILARPFYQRDTSTVARDLIGKIVVRTIAGHVLKGRIVETESYRNDDPACHAYAGETARTKALYGLPGHAYVYFTYGVHWCLNMVAHEPPYAGGVLIRALEPIEGIDIMQENRGQKHLTQLMNGPGRLTEALGITKKDYGIDVTQEGLLYILDDNSVQQDLIVATSRIGISKSQELPLRFCLSNSPYLSLKIKN